MVIRDMIEEDLSFLLEVRNDPSTRLSLENDSEFTLEQAKTWFSAQRVPWLIIIKNGVRVGYVRRSLEENGMYIGIDIHPSYRRRGIAKETYTLILQGGTFFLWVFEDNFARQLYLQVGFVATGNRKLVRGRGYVEMKYQT